LISDNELTEEAITRALIRAYRLYRTVDSVRATRDAISSLLEEEREGGVIEVSRELIEAIMELLDSLAGEMNAGIKGLIASGLLRDL
jgi:uncharacterized protein YjaG (DUF416 family)